MFGGKKKEPRFVLRDEHGQKVFTLSGVQIMEDTQTGVHYLVTMGGDGLTGITPLLDQNGQVVIRKDTPEQGPEIR